MKEEITDLLEIEIGVRQGCVLSPKLFILVIDFVTCHSIDHLHIGIPWTVGNLLADLNFADDIVITGLTQTALWDLALALENQAASTGLRINGQKTKLIRTGYVNSRVLITTDGKKVEEFANFTYLGSVVSSNGDAE